MLSLITNLLFFFLFPQSSIHCIRLADGLNINVYCLNDSETKSYLDTMSWSEFVSANVEMTSGILINQKGEIINTNFNNGRSILFKSASDFEFIQRPDLLYVVFKYSEKTNRLLYFQYLHPNLKTQLKSSLRGKSIDYLKLKKGEKAYILSDNKILLSLKDGEGKLFNSMDDYIEFQFNN